MNQYVFNSFHSSVAAFSFDLVPATPDNPHQLTVIVGDDKEALARYFSYEATKEAIRTQKTGFPPWDSLPAAIAASEFSEQADGIRHPSDFQRSERLANRSDPKQMKFPIIGVLLFTSIAFISCGQVAAVEREAASEEAASVQILNLCVLPSGKVVLKCKNSGNKPVKAFKGKWVVFDDFNEASQSDDILFTSNTAVMGSNALLGGYLIQPNSIIYLVNDGNQRVAMVGRLASDAFGNLEDVPPTWKKRFKAAITNIIFAEQEDVDNLRKQEEALREQESLRQQEMTRRAEDAAREADRKRRLDQIVAKSQTATREIARIPMEDSREHFIVTDVSVEYRGARKDFRRPPNLHAGGSRAIVEDGTYSYFANQADRDKALRIFNEAIKAWQKKFSEAIEALDAPAPPPAAPRAPQDPAAASPPSNPATQPQIDPVPPVSNTPATEPQTYVVVGLAADDFLNVRSTPAMNSPAVFKLANGDQVQIRGKSVFNGDTEWIPVTAGSQQGWVRNKYLQPKIR